jgi:hypothetical protein
MALHANFRMTGWRWPFRVGDGLEVWRGHELVGEISVELLVSLVTHYLVGHDLVRQFDAAIIPAAPGLRPARPLVTLAAPGRAVRDRDYRAALRARRRARRKPEPVST